MEESQRLLDDDVKPKKEYKTPKRLSTFAGRLLSLIVVFICCVLASGPLTGFPTLQPLLEQAGVFQGRNQGSLMSMLYTVSQSAATICYFFTGLLYDRLGPRKTAAYGALLVTIGFCLIFVAIKIPSLNWLMFIAMPWTYQWGQFNSFAIYGYVWFFPDHQSLIIGITNSSSTVTSLLVYAFIILRDFGISLTTSMIIFGIASGFAAIIVWPFAPSRRDTLNAAIRAGSPSNTEHIPIADVLRGVVAELSKHKMANFLFIVWNDLQYTLAVYYTGVLDNYMQVFVGNVEMGKIAYAYALINSLVGFVGSPFIGALVDKIGIRWFLFASNIVLLIWFISIFIPNLYVQYASICLITVFFTGVALVGPRWTMIYCRADLFGSFYGIQFTTAGLLSIIVSPILTTLSAYLPGVWAYWVPIGGLFFVTYIMSLVLNIYLWKYPPPVHKPVQYKETN